MSKTPIVKHKKFPDCNNRCPAVRLFPKIGKVIPTAMLFPVDIKYCCYIRRKIY